MLADGASPGDRLFLPSEAGVIGKLPAIPNINMGSRKVYPGPHCGTSDVTMESFPSLTFIKDTLEILSGFVLLLNKILFLFDFFLFI